jgi:hypothetical protein
LAVEDGALAPKARLILSDHTRLVRRTRLAAGS